MPMLTATGDIERKFILEFINEVYKACDCLGRPVPDEIDDVLDLDEMIEIANSFGCSLVPKIVPSDEWYEIRARVRDVERLKKIFSGLPLFRLRIVPNACSVVYSYFLEVPGGEFNVIHYQHEKVCLVSFFNGIDIQMMKFPGDADSDTRIAVGKDACEMVKFLEGELN